jgi:uncharacterized protein YcbK (DUF882 family)
MIPGMREAETRRSAVDRRRFLLRAGGLAIAGLGAANRLAFAAPMPLAATRVRLVEARSGTVFDGAYRDAHGPIRHAMDELDMFLRDRHTGGMTGIDVGVIDFLAKVMASIGENSAVVLSAYRSLPTNALLERTQFGVADNSQHLFGRALDVSFPAAKLADAVNAARAMKRGGVGWYPKSKFIHIDTGPVRNWDLDAEGLQEHLLGKGSPAAAPDPKTVGVKPAPKLPQVTVDGVKETLVTPSAKMPAVRGRVAGLLGPATRTQ